MSNVPLPRLPWWAWAIAFGSVAAVINLVTDPLPVVDAGFVVSVFLVNIGMWLVICGAVALLIWLVSRLVGRTD